MPGRRGVEVKSGYAYRSPDNLSQLARARALVDEGWSITWRIDGLASRNLLDDLRSAGIRYEFRAPSLRPTGYIKVITKHMNKKKIPTPENFQDWLDFMDYELQSFLDDLPLSVEEQLDYSVESLSVLEKYILDQYETIQ